MTFLLMIAAYVAGFLAVAPLAGLAGSLVALLPLPGAPYFRQGASSFIGAVLAYWLLSLLFNACGATYFWFSYLLCMLGVVLNDGKRAQGGESSAYATGTSMGIIASLIFHFFS